MTAPITLRMSETRAPSVSAGPNGGLGMSEFEPRKVRFPGTNGGGGAVIQAPFGRLGDPQPAQDGRDGFALETPVDPTALF